MKRQYVTELAEGVSVDSVFALRTKEVRSARSGIAYLALELADRTGHIPAVLFRPDVASQRVPAGSIVRVRGTVTSYRGSRRISIDQLRVASSHQPEDFVPSGRCDIEEMDARFDRLAGVVGDRRLRALLDAVFGDTAFHDRFRACPGAQSHHHAYLGGLLEHTVAVAETCERACDAYPVADRDLLVACALLHDVGKVDELAFDTCISYTDEGRLLGHVVLGERRVSAAVARAGVVPDTLAARVSHILLSHHGELEWGSPKRPAMIEALILHHVDNMDAKVSGFIELVRGASAADERWTDVSNLFRRPLYVPRCAEDDRWLGAEEDDAGVAIGA